MRALGGAAAAAATPPPQPWQGGTGLAGGASSLMAGLSRLLPAAGSGGGASAAVAAAARRRDRRLDGGGGDWRPSLQPTVLLQDLLGAARRGAGARGRGRGRGRRRRRRGGRRRAPLAPAKPCPPPPWLIQIFALMAGALGRGPLGMIMYMIRKIIMLIKYNLRKWFNTLVRIMRGGVIVPTLDDRPLPWDIPTMVPYPAVKPDLGPRARPPRWWFVPPRWYSEAPHWMMAPPFVHDSPALLQFAEGGGGGGGGGAAAATDPAEAERAAARATRWARCATAPWRIGCGSRRCSGGSSSSSTASSTSSERSGTRVTPADDYK